MLDWTPVQISGKFSHGNLYGSVEFVTSNYNLIFATFRNGVIHGPVFAYGVSLVLKKHYDAKGLRQSWLLSLNPILYLFFPNLFYICSTSYCHFITRILSLSYFHMKTAPSMITFSI